MTGRVSGLLVSEDDADYLARALDLLADLLRQHGSRPTEKLAGITDTLRTGANTGATRPKTGVDARILAREQDSCQPSWHAVVDTGEAARILGITSNGVRDLARRGTLPSRLAGGRRILDAAAVVRRAEQRR